MPSMNGALGFIVCGEHTAIPILIAQQGHTKSQCWNHPQSLEIYKIIRHANQNLFTGKHFSGYTDYLFDSL